MIIHIFYTYIHIHLMNKYIKQQTKAFLKKKQDIGQWRGNCPTMGNGIMKTICVLILLCNTHETVRISPFNLTIVYCWH